MSDDNFVSRWSRLKRESAQRRKTPAEPEATDVRPSELRDARTAEASQEARKPELPFDPATLPAIDSIVAGSDIRAFLQKGVPAELTKAALRRAWTSDPAIRDFIGLAENQWDFTDPTAIPGFGPLQAADNVGQLVAQAMGKLPDMPDPALSAAKRQDEEAVQPEMLDAPVAGAQQQSTDRAGVETAALQHPEPAPESAPDIAMMPRRKGHGGALPG